MEGGGTLIFDVETFSKDLLYVMPPEEFVRLAGYKWAGSDDVVVTTDLEELRNVIRSARWCCGHNIHDFDLRAIFGTESNEPLQLAIERRVYDTWTHAALVNPIPREYVNRRGQFRKAPGKGWSPEQMLPWFALDEQAFQLGVQGKTADLAELAREFGDPELKGKEREVSGYGRIPVDDPRYRDYLVGDVRASEAVAKALIKKGPLDEYAMREQEIDARKAVISSNGWRVDRKAAQARVDALAERREVILKELQEGYGLPVEGDAPWGTDAGKAAILAALADHGITPESVDWPKTAAGNDRRKHEQKMEEKRGKIQDKIDGWSTDLRGELTPFRRETRLRQIARAKTELDEAVLPSHFGLSFGGEELITLTKGTTAEELGSALAELKGQRSLAQLALDSTYPDGKVHPEITMLQRSGRWSTTKPGLTIWTDKGPGAVEKSYFIPDTDDDVLMEFDLSNADARVVAAESGDRKYAERFLPGADGHMINALAAWGKETVDTDPKGYRQKAKPLGHGWSYGGRPKGLQRASGLPLEVAESFCDGMDKTFNVLVQWQNRVRSFATKHGYVVNDWGRVMRVEKGREFTQAPALIGQNGTREIMCDILLEMPIPVLRRVKAQIHDALVMSIPRKNWEACRDYMLNLMNRSYKPKQGGQRIDFPASAGPPGESWFEARHD